MLPKFGASVAKRGNASAFTTMLGAEGPEVAFPINDKGGPEGRLAIAPT